MAKAKRPAPSSVRDIMSGVAHATAERIFALIHDVNPTGRNVSERDRERRYREKSALQSLLIREHAESLTFEIGSGEGVVTIRHADLGYDACHAVLDDLELDARSIVRRKLDEAAAERAQPMASTDRASARVARTSTPGDPIEDGRRALAEYDYETARAAFEAALAQSAGGLDAAVALLELLVDTLADDAGALALLPRLGEATKKAPWIRLKLGTAAARQGNVEDAARWVSGMDVEGVADVWIACAESSLSQGDLERAQEWLQRAGKVDPHAGADTKRRVAAARADRLRALEVELAALADRGADAEARARAEAILAAFPESREARSHLAAANDRDMRRRGEAQLERAREAAGRGAADTALSILLGELDHQSGAFKATLEVEIDALRAVVAKTRLDSAVERILARRATDPRGALVELAGAAPAVRAEVRRRGLDAAFEIADALSSFDTAEKVASAALAIAETLGAPREASEIVRRLEPHRALVSRIARANELLRRAAAELREEAVRAARAAMDAAIRAMAEGHGAAARDHLRAIDRAVLDAATRDVLRDLEARTNALLEAERMDAVQGALDEQYDPLVVDGPFEAWAAFVSLGGQSNQVSLRAEHDEIILTGGAADETCLYVLDARTGALRRTLLARSGHAHDVAVFGGDAYVTGFTAAVTIIDLVTFRLRLVSHLPRRAGRIDSFALAADEHVYAWMTDDQRGIITVARVDRPDATRTIEGEAILRRIHAPDRERVLSASFDDGTATLHTASGRVVGRLNNALPIDAAEPDGGGGLVVLGAENHDEGEVQLVHLDGQGKVLATRDLDDVHPEMARSLAVDPANGLAYLRYRDANHEPRMAAYDYRSPELPPRFDLPCDADVSFVTDRRVSRVLALHRQGEAIVVQALPDVPTYPAKASEIPRDAVWDGVPYDCEWKPPLGATAAAAIEELRPLRHRQRVERARVLAEMLGDDLGAKIAVIGVLSRDDEGFDKAVEEILGEQWDAPVARMLRLAHLLDRAEWENARDLAMRTDAVPQELDAHRRHLLAVAHAGLGDIERAQGALDPVVPGCPASGALASYLGKLDAVANGRDKESALALLVTAMRDADRAMEQGDFEAAWHALNVPEAWAVRALQHAARAAHCVMALPAQTPAQQARRRLVTAMLRERWRDRAIWPGHLLLGGMWPQDRIREVAKRAGAKDAD